MMNLKSTWTTTEGTWFFRKRCAVGVIGKRVAMPDESESNAEDGDHKRAGEIAREAFVLAHGAIRQTTAMRKEGGSDEEIALLCDLLKGFDALVKRELLEHLSPSITTFASGVRAEQREADAKTAETVHDTEFDEDFAPPLSEKQVRDRVATAIRNEVEP